MARYQALDALRGLTIAMMILVNTPGSWSHIYAPLRHAQWHGCTPTDLVFPFFLFIVGSAMFFSFKKSLFAFSQSAAVKIIKRACIIFAIGWLLNAYPFIGDWSEIRTMGVLQRIAIAYAIAALLVLLVSRRQLWLISIATLLGYWLLLAVTGDAYQINQNIVQKIDLSVIGAARMWHIGDIAFDPEGLLSTLPAVINVLIGFETTRYLSSLDSKQQAAKNLVFIGLSLIALGGLWGLALPINKSLWTSSFVLFSSGFALLVLAAFIWLIDIKGKLNLAKPWLVYGMNPLFIYVLSWVWVTSYYLVPIGDTDLHNWIYQALQAVSSPVNASLIFAIVHVSLFWLISYFLYHRNIIIKI